MTSIFSYCHALEYVDLSNFDTWQTTSFAGAFVSCYALTSIDLSNFNSTASTQLHYLFDKCYALTSVNISHFDTSNVKNMGHMFDQCRALTYLDLSNFNTSLVTNADNMFYNCHNLEFLDVSSFNTENINNLNTFFIDCNKLKSLNLSGFAIFDTTNVNDILKNADSNLLLCYNESKMPSKFLEQAIKFENSCLKLCLMISKKYILETEMCVDNCYSETYYKYEYNNICYSRCPNRTELQINSEYLCEECRNYYNYEQTECLAEVPEGYYNNHTLNKTIDKCPIKC